MTLKIGLLGGGSWGTTIASLTSKKVPTKIWARDEKTVSEINSTNSNSKYLPGLELHSDLRAEYEIKDTVYDADVVVMAIPSNNFRAVLDKASHHIRPWVPIISLTKGLEISSKKRMTEIIEELMPGHPTGVLTGPNLAKEILAGQAAASVLATVDQSIAIALQQVFNAGLFRVYTNNDVIGCELGGALKNVIAIAAGMSDGAGAGDNTRAAIITRGLAEISRLGIAMGGQPITFAGLAGMGDLVATCSSTQSRNRSVGFQLGQGKKIDDIINSMSMVAEGVKTASVVMQLSEQFDIPMPLSHEVYKVVNEGNSIANAFRGLLNHKIGSESDPG